MRRYRLFFAGFIGLQITIHMGFALINNRIRYNSLFWVLEPCLQAFYYNLQVDNNARRR